MKHVGRRRGRAIWKENNGVPETVSIHTFPCSNLFVIVGTQKLVLVSVFICLFFSVSLDFYIQKKKSHWANRLTNIYLFLFYLAKCIPNEPSYRVYKRMIMKNN